MAKPPDLPQSSRTSTWSIPRWLILGGLILVLTAAGVFFANRPGDVAPVPPSTQPTSPLSEEFAGIEPSQLPFNRSVSRQEAGYVGSEACKKCHAGIAESYEQTKHFHACRIPVPDKMPPGFEPGRNQLTTSVPGLKFEMSHEEGKYFQNTIRTTAAGESKHRARIDLIYGAGGTADDVFLSWRDDDHLVELPMVWLYPPQMWGASHFDPNSGGDFSRALTVRCLECHNTWLEHVAGTANQYRRRDAIISITCESCHGPGHEHVTFHETHPDENIGHAIVQPGSLSRELQLDVCLQCHSNAINRKQPAFSYRPGRPLSDYYRTLTVTHNEDDHVANQIQYLRESACFQKSNDMTCATCHDPHRPTGPDNAGSQSCRQCHEPDACTDRPRLPEALRDDCVRCHMRPYLKINVNFQTADDNFVVPFRRYDHQISVNPIARQELLLKWNREQDGEEARREAGRLAQRLAQHWRDEARKLHGEHRYLAEIAALREAVAIEATPELKEELKKAVALQQSLDDEWANALMLMSQSKSAQAIESLSKILSLRPADARAHGKVGTQYAQVGEKEKAIEHLEAVATHDPDDAYGHAMLGWLAYLDGKPQAALSHYEKADQIEPFEAKIQYHMGLAFAQLNQLAQAAERLEKALRIDPRQMAACETLIAVRRQQKRFPEAIALCKHAVEQTGRANIDVLMTLAMTCAEAGQRSQAQTTAEEALRLARSQGSPKLPQIEQVLMALRSQTQQTQAP